METKEQLEILNLMIKQLELNPPKTASKNEIDILVGNLSVLLYNTLNPEQKQAFISIIRYLNKDKIVKCITSYRDLAEK